MPANISGFVPEMLCALGHPRAEPARLGARPFTPLTFPNDSLIMRSESARPLWG